MKDKPKYYIVSFSGGKDSTAMLLRMLELGSYQIDEVIFIDVGMEFTAIYEHVSKIKKVVESYKIKFTVLRADKDFEYYLAKHPYVKKDGTKSNGYGWTRGVARWCTSILKGNVAHDYVKGLKEYDVYKYIGLANDEQHRLARKLNKNKRHLHPLVDWGWSEADALQYCYSKGYDFGGLYKLFNRCSCWCCPLQRISELRKLYENYPKLWEELKRLDKLSPIPFRKNWSIEMFEARFRMDKKREKMGLTTNPRTKEYKSALKECLKDCEVPYDRVGTNRQ